MALDTSPRPAAAPVAQSLRPTGARGSLAVQDQAPLLPGLDGLFRGIYTRAGIGAPDVVAVCSAIADEGKTTVSLGLAATLAQDFPDWRLLVVETNFAAPVLAADFGLEPGPGLAGCLLDDVPLPTECRGTALANLYLLPSGELPPAAGRVLRSGRMASAISRMRERFDVVVLDAPAILGDGDALPLLDLADGALFVVRAGATPTEAADKALGLIERDKIRGVVLNGVDSAVPGSLRRLCGL
jgi:polysaccharide biosynthesis transport protein